jgi:hypothetical protein
MVTRGPKTKEIVKAEILKLKRHNPDITAIQILKKLRKKFTSTYLPKERAIANIVRKNIDKTKPSILDNPWSMACLTEYPVFHECLDTLLKIQADLKKIADLEKSDAKLSIRIALWIARLLKVPSQKPLNENSSLDELKEWWFNVLFAAINFSLYEEVCEINQIPCITTLFDAPTLEEIQINITKYQMQQLSADELAQAKKDPEEYFGKALSAEYDLSIENKENKAGE